MNETRNILLVGRTGQGKSSLANLLVNKNGNFEEVFREGSGSISTTKNPQTETFKEGNITYQIIDTPSFSDTELSSGSVEDEGKIFYKLAQMASEIKGGINQILFVSDGRFTEEEVKVIGGLRSIVFDEKMAGYLTIVRTRFPEFEDSKKCKEDYESLTKEELINQNRIGARLVKTIGGGKFIHVDNPSVRGSESAKKLATETKKVARSKLLNHLMNARVSYEPENLVKLKKRIEDSVNSIEKEKKAVQGKIEDARKELEKLRIQRSSSKAEKSRKEIEHEKWLNDLISQSNKLEEEKNIKARSVASNLFEENMNMIIKASETGSRIGRESIWGIGGPVGGLIGYGTGVGGALFNSGVTLLGAGVNFLTGGKGDKPGEQAINPQLIAQLSSQNERIKLAEEIIFGLRQQLQDKDKKINEQSQTIQINQIEINFLKQQVNNSQDEVGRLKPEITRLNSSVNDLRGQLEEKTTLAQKNQVKIGGLESQVQTLQQQKESQQQRISENQAEINSLKNQVDSVQKEKERLAREIEALKNAKQDTGIELNSTITDLQNKLTNSQNQIDQLQGEKTALVQQNQAKEQQIEENQTKINELEQQIQRLQRRVETLQGMLNSPEMEAKIQQSNLPPHPGKNN